MNKVLEFDSCSIFTCTESPFTHPVDGMNFNVTLDERKIPLCSLIICVDRVGDPYKNVNPFTESFSVLPTVSVETTYNSIFPVRLELINDESWKLALTPLTLFEYHVTVPPLWNFRATSAREHPLESVHPTVMTVFGETIALSTKEKCVDG